MKTVYLAAIVMALSLFAGNVQAGTITIDASTLIDGDVGDTDSGLITESNSLTSTKLDTSKSTTKNTSKSTTKSSSKSQNTNTGSTTSTMNKQ